MNHGSFSSTVIKLQQQLNRIQPNEPFEEEEVREMLFDAIFTKISDTDLDKIFSGKNQELLEQGKLKEEDILVLIEQKIPNFSQIMKELSKEICEEYKNS
ncbi:hypothetical protein XF24_01026 [candidate division SR1 bacterium Aalborg_AAW-1]|nr:hypothetical protein XF24_01026 [candidate division SR1 bacterium Aalborg_AAW-1]